MLLHKRNFYVSLATFALMASLVMGAGRCSKYAVTIDPLPVYAMEANDATVIIEGCGNQPAVGYTYCRVREGGATDGQEIKIKIPPTACARQSCANIKVFYPDGSPTFGIDIPRGQTEAVLTFKELTKKATFVKDNRGFWPVLLEWFWVDENGYEHRTTAEGEIRLRVLLKDYVPLHEVKDADEWGWRWTDEKYRYRMSTKGRAFAWVL